MQKIVILESFEFLALKIQKILKEYGYNNITIINTVGKYDTNIRNILEESSFIIADLDNHGYDPIELMESNNMEVPIIFMSETGDLEKIKRVINAGGKDFLLKPFETELLINKMSRFIFEENSFNNKINDSEIFPKTKIALEWNPGFEIGVSQIDIEHKSIIENYKRLYNEMKGGDGLKFYPELLKFLQDYIISHFINEEALQKEIGYYEYEKHKEMHENFTKSINEYTEKEKNSGANYHDLITISLFVKDWLIHHILIEDRKIGDFINRRKN